MWSTDGWGVKRRELHRVCQAQVASYSLASPNRSPWAKSVWTAQEVRMLGIDWQVQRSMPSSHRIQRVPLSAPPHNPLKVHAPPHNPLKVHGGGNDAWSISWWVWLTRTQSARLSVRKCSERRSMYALLGLAWGDGLAMGQTGGGV
jgi:hypothetical protein